MIQCCEQVPLEINIYRGQARYRFQGQRRATTLQVLKHSGNHKYRGCTLKGRKTLLYIFMKLKRTQSVAATNMLNRY